MASQQQNGRAASKARRQLQVNGKPRSVAATAPTRQPKRKPVPAVNPTLASAPQTVAPVAPSFTAPVNMPKPKAAQKSASRLRRESLAARGKRADRSSDRLRTSEMALKRRSAAEAKVDKGNCGCGGSCCQEAEAKAAAVAVPTPSLNTPASNSFKAGKRRRAVNASDTGRMLSRARRTAMSGRGKAGLEAHSKGNSSASLARQADPEISGRDLARVVRESRSKSGARGSTSAAPARARRPRNAAEAKAISGTKVSHSAKTTGDETGLCRDVTGTEYFSSEVFTEFCQTTEPKVPAKVKTSENLSGNAITASGKVGRSKAVTGDERGTCNAVTGVEYVGREQYDNFCKAAPEAGSAKVSFSQTTRGQVISGSKPIRSNEVSGNERGTCKAVTGTPYTGVEEFQKYCEPSQLKSVVDRTPPVSANAGRDITGIQPGFSGLTGMEKGVCREVSGTNYVAESEQQEACAATPAQMTDSDFPQPLNGQAWGEFSVVANSPATKHASVKPAEAAPVVNDPVTGTRYEQGRVSGTFSLGEGKITGTENFRFGEAIKPRGEPRANTMFGSSVMSSAPATPADNVDTSRITGEGLDAGLKITGNDWNRGDHVTGTEGASAKRNPTRRGPVSAMPEMAPVKEVKKVVEERSNINVTGGSGTSDDSARVTVSGGARG